MADHPFIFICGADDYLVNRLGKERFDGLAREVADEFSREIISGFAGNVDEVGAAVGRFRESVQTIPLFGGRRVVWLKDVNFLADTVTGRAEGTLAQVEALQELLEKNHPADTAIVVTAAPVDRRRAFLKWCEKCADFTLVGGDDARGDSSMFEQVVLAEAKTEDFTLTPDALALLLAKTGANSRLLVEEVHKLATYADEGGTIGEAEVDELTPNTAEGDFFEAAEAFFSGNLPRTLAVLRRHFFAGGDARPLLGALQNRNRILIQIRALLDAGELRIGSRGLDAASFSRAAAAHSAAFAGAGKSSFNLFSQNPWYLGKLAGAGNLPPLRRLIDHQQEFVVAFEEINRRPREQEEVLAALAVRCLAPA